MNEFSDVALLKNDPYVMYIDGRSCNENSFFLDGEEPTSEADTKPMEDSEGNKIETPVVTA